MQRQEAEACKRLTKANEDVSDAEKPFVRSTPDKLKKKVTLQAAVYRTNEELKKFAQSGLANGIKNLRDATEALKKATLAHNTVAATKKTPDNVNVVQQKIDESLATKWEMVDKLTQAREALNRAEKRAKKTGVDVKQLKDEIEKARNKATQASEEAHTVNKII